MAAPSVRQRRPDRLGEAPSDVRPARRIRSHSGPRRSATSLWLPWLAGLLALLSIAAISALMGGRVDGGVAVPSSVLDLQRAAVASAADQVRTTIEGGVRDLGQFADVLSTAADDAAIKGQVEAFAKRYRRYRSVYLADASGGVVAATGQAPHPALVPKQPRRTGVTDAVSIDNIAVVLQYAPVSRAAGLLTVVAEYDLARLRFALDGLRPATAWIVNANGEVVASTGGFVAFERLDTGKLSKAVGASKDTDGVSLSQGIDAGEIIAYAPVRDADPSPVVPHWGLVSTRGVSTIDLPQSQARDQALLVGLAVTIVTIGVFGWMYAMWLRPLRRLIDDANRVAHGDLSTPVRVRRHDEIGLIARSVERIRVGLLRDIPPHRGTDDMRTRTVPREFE